MPTRYVIEGNRVSREEWTSTTCVELDSFIENLTSYLPLSLCPMPKDIKYISVDPSSQPPQMMTKVIVQRDPAVRRINFIQTQVTNESKSYQIAMPFSFFWFVLRSNTIYGVGGSNIMWTPLHWGVFWSNEPFMDLTTPVIGARLPNCYPDGNICWGTTNVRTNQPFGHFIDAAINTFFLSEFNQDIDFPWPYRTMDEWQEESLADPEVWRRWPIWSDGSFINIGERLNNFNDGEWRNAQPSSLTDEPIPEIERIPTFRMVNDWLERLTDDQIDRLRWSIDNRDKIWESDEIDPAMDPED